MINVHGLKMMELVIWNFMVADIQTSRIGADFLKKFNVVLDLNRKRLVDGKTLISAKCATQVSTQISVHLVTKYESVDDRVIDLFKKFPNITSPPQYQEKQPKAVVPEISPSSSKDPKRS